MLIPLHFQVQFRMRKYAYIPTLIVHKLLVLSSSVQEVFPCFQSVLLSESDQPAEAGLRVGGGGLKPLIPPSLSIVFECGQVFVSRPLVSFFSMTLARA